MIISPKLSLIDQFLPVPSYPHHCTQRGPELHQLTFCIFMKWSPICGPLQTLTLLHTEGTALHQNQAEEIQMFSTSDNQISLSERCSFQLLTILLSAHIPKGHRVQTIHASVELSIFLPDYKNTHTVRAFSVHPTSLSPFHKLSSCLLVYLRQTSPCLRELGQEFLGKTVKGTDRWQFQGHTTEQPAEPSGAHFLMSVKGTGNQTL